VTTTGSKRWGHLASYSEAMAPAKWFSGTPYRASAWPRPDTAGAYGPERGRARAYAACDWLIQVSYISA
jgi:hypothetical protein